MRSRFTSSFRPAGFRQVALMRPAMGFKVSRGATLGRSLSSAEIDAYTATIESGRKKLARINAWINSKRAAQPFGWTLFDDAQVQTNFYNWMDTMNSDQPAVDRVQAMIEDPVSADYEIPDGDLDRVDEWALMVEYMTQAMQQYGTGVKPGSIVGPTPGRTPSGTTATTPPSKGVTTKDALTYGGIGLGAIALILLLKGA